MAQQVSLWWGWGISSFFEASVTPDVRGFIATPQGMVSPGSFQNNLVQSRGSTGSTC